MTQSQPMNLRLTESRVGEHSSEAKGAAPDGMLGKTVYPSSHPAALPIVMCGACRRSILPRLALPAWHRDVHRTAAEGMVKRDPAVEQAVKRAKRRNSRKDARRLERRAIRAAFRSGDLPGAVRLHLSTNTASIASSAPAEDCDRCLALRARLARRALMRSVAGAA